jgi:hypothetical protein
LSINRFWGLPFKMFKLLDPYGPWGSAEKQMRRWSVPVYQPSTRLGKIWTAGFVINR